MTSSEVENIIARYQRREQKQALFSSKMNSLFESFCNKEREKEFSTILSSRYHKDLSSLKVIEIGAGEGINIKYFKSIGILPKNIWANELLDIRVNRLKENHSDINILPGNALDISIKNKFDIVLQSMVFSSILDANFRQSLASKMLQLLKEDGMILWYDFTYNNPWNKDVKRVKRQEIKSLFLNTEQKYQRVTLLPHIARRIGKHYRIINKLFPFLRTHLVAVIIKNKTVIEV